MTLGDNIKRFRKQNNLTQKELGELIGKSTISIRKYESNDISPSIKVLNDISKVLNTSIGNLTRPKKGFKYCGFDIVDDNFNPINDSTIDIGLLLGANDTNREVINTIATDKNINDEHLESTINGIISSQEISETKQLFKRFGYSIDLTCIPYVYIRDERTNKDIAKLTLNDLKTLSTTLKISLNSIIDGFISSFKINNGGGTDGE